MNALLLPVVLGFLHNILARLMAGPYRLSGGYAVVAALTIVLTTGIGVYVSLVGVGR